MKATICDVGPRDGLQNEPEPLSAQIRAELVNRLAAVGVPRIEAASFVHQERVPQMAGAEEVAAGIEPRDGTIYAGLVLNEKGYERLAATALGEVHFSFGATETFNRRNANASVDESVAAARRISERAHSDGRTFVVSISVAFGCPFEGEVAPAHVLELAERIVAGGADEVVLADTIGVGVPSQVSELVGPPPASEARRESTSTTRAARALRTHTPRSKRARQSSTPRWAVSAAARSHRGRPETSQPRTSCTSCTAREWRPASTWKG